MARDVPPRPEDFINDLPSLIGTMRPIQYQSCFISYSSMGEEFARRLHEKMRGKKLRVWFAPEDMQGGKVAITARRDEPFDRRLPIVNSGSGHFEGQTHKARHAER
jgi:hypothetical protein